MFNRAWFSAAVLFIAFGAPLAHAAITDQAIFVAKTGSDANGGTQASPKQTISAGITAAVAVAIPNVVVSKGVYAEVVNLPNGISLFGGYDATAGWTRAPANTTTIQAASMPLRIQTYSAIGQVDGFTIQATSSGTPGSSTIGILLNNAGGIRISRNVIVAAAGINGTAGNNGPAVLPATAPFGNSGGPGCSGTGCGVGGLGGNSACGAAGGKGGNAGTGSNNGQFGTAGSGAPPGGSPGSGGTSAGCGSLSTPGNPGASGSVGTQGNPGTGGTGGTASPSGWVSAAGTNGSVGTSAKGGGGGGGGGGGQTFAFPSCTDETGGGGGGGGAGGCGGNLGQGGGGGGGSIAILSLNSAAAQIVANNIQAGAGGNGGHGGSGSPGQVGGAGANAGPLFDKAGAGGNGGNGGDGGAGAGGGGGAGGPSNGIFAAGGLGIASNTINTGGPGFGGGGGTTPGGGTAGSGQNGSPAQTSGASTVTPLTLTVAKAGTGAGTVASDVGWIDCGATCSEIYGSGVVVALSATVSVGSTFTGWSGDCTGTGACNVTMDAARTVTATFTLLNPQSITFDALADKPYPSAPFTVSATGGASGNPVVFSSLTTGVCTTSGTNGTTVTIFAAGLCRIAANQAGNGTYAAAPQVTQSFTVTGLFRAYVSKNGSDANPCTLAQPCRLLPAALTLVNEGGEIWMLDSANFNVGTVNVFKSVTVLAVPGALGSVVANGADAIVVNSSTTTELALRNVVIVNLSGAGNYGIRFLQGSQVTLEGSEIYGVDTGILVAAPGGLLTVRDTMIRDTAIQGVVLTGGVTGSLEGVALVNNSGFGIQVIGGAQATFTGGMISGSGTGANVAASGTTTARLTLSATELSDNGTALSVSAAAGADTAHAILEDVTISHNTTGVALSGAGTTAVFSRQNNSLKFNGTDVTGGALTPQAAF